MANDDTDTSGMPQADATPELKLTAYGYPGDSTPDNNSRNRIGDHDNEIQNSPDHQSVALTVPERERVFGYSGHSRGQPFTYGGKTYYDDDTAPEGDYRIDVFNPDHAPDDLSLASGHTHDFRAQKSVMDQPKSALYQPWTPPKEDLAPVPEPEKETPRVGKADNSILAPENMISRIRAIHPEYAKVGDQKLYASFKQKFPTGLRQLRAVFPEYAKTKDGKPIPDNKFLQAIREKFFANDSDDEFTDRVNPPSGVAGIYHSIAEQMPRIVSGWYQGTSELSKFPQRAVSLLDRAVIALGMDKKLPDQAVTPLTKQLLSGIVDPKIAQDIFNWGTKQSSTGEKWTRGAHIPEAHTFAGAVARKAFEWLGATPAIAPAFIPGVGAGTALVLGMGYDFVQGEGKAREKGLDNSLMFGSEGLSYRGVQQWLMYTPRGRALSALLWAFGGMADQEAQALLTDPKGEMNRAFSQPVNTAADLLSTGAVNAVFGGLASLGVEKLTGPEKAAFEEASTARENGDYKTAAQLLDKTMLLLPEPVRKAATNNLLAWRNEAIEARPGDTPMEMPGQRGFLVLKGKMSEEPFLESKGVEMRPQGEPAPEEPAGAAQMGVRTRRGNIYTGANAGEAIAKATQAEMDLPGMTLIKDVGEIRNGKFTRRNDLSPPRTIDVESGPDGMTDQFYYSGIDIGKMYEDIANSKAMKWTRELLAPEHETEARETAGAAIGEQIAKMQRENQRMAQQWYHKQQLEDALKFAYKSDQRKAFWAGLPKGTRMKMFEQHEAGISTGNKVADRMFQLHDGLMKAINHMDQQRGFMYNMRDSYIMHAVEKQSDIAKVESEMKRRGWGDPDFMHAREVPTVEMLHAMGVKLKTYNLEELDQMRLAQSNLAEMRAASLESLHAAGLALSRFDLAKLEKANPQMAKDIREQVGETPWRSPRSQGRDDAHQTYWLHKEADFMLHRATDPVLWHPVVGAVVQGLNAIKQRTVGLNLAWSAYHHVHMLSIGAADTLSSAYSKHLAGTATVGDWSKAVEDVMSLGLGSHVRSLSKNQKRLNWYLGNDAKHLTDLSPHDQKMFALEQEGGFVPLVSHERQIQIGRTLMANRIGKTADKALDTGYAILTARPYQTWLFGRVIPSLKMYSYDRAAMSLLEARPELNRPEYTMQRKIELRKIRDQVDARYGEQNLRQSFTDPHVKYLGQATLLSYSWLKSFIDVYGGGIHDLTKFVKERPEKPQATNRIAYMMTLSALTAATNMLIAQFLGAGVRSLQDLFYPNIGYGKDGKTLARVKPPFWITTEFGGMQHDIEQKGGNVLGGMTLFFQNKMQPALSTIGELASNKDYYGTDISPTWDAKKDFWTNFMEQVWTKAEFGLKQGSSFTLQAGLKPGAEPRDMLLQMLGVPRAPAYAERSGLENMIVRDYVDYLTKKGTTRTGQEQMDARRDYRMAIQNGDGEAEQKALERMHQLGISDKSIRDVKKTANETEAQRLFSHMPIGNKDNPAQGEQRYYWDRMSDDEKREFWPFLHKDLKKEFPQ